MPVHPTPPLNTRPGEPLTKVASTLGPLADLAGTWVGSGFILISLPDFDSTFPSTGPKDFRLKLNATREILEFTPIGGPIPNRGSVTDLGNDTGQPDINLFGLTYLQRVSDLVTNEPLHIEPGIWINAPATTVLPNQQATVVRMGTVPHGDSFLAQSTLVTTVAAGPTIQDVSSTPTGPGITPGYLTPFTNPPLPPGILLPWVQNPNLALVAAIQGQTIIKTVVLVISTNPVGGIVNIPFVVSNANAIQLDAIFWIETVQQSDGIEFLQLQYTQTVILNFLGINWPHIAVATLVKQ